MKACMLIYLADFVSKRTRYTEQSSSLVNKSILFSLTLPAVPLLNIKYKIKITPTQKWGPLCGCKMDDRGKVSLLNVSQRKELMYKHGAGMRTELKQEKDFPFCWAGPHTGCCSSAPSGSSGTWRWCWFCAPAAASASPPPRGRSRTLPPAGCVWGWWLGLERLCLEVGMGKHFPRVCRSSSTINTNIEGTSVTTAHPPWPRSCRTLACTQYVGSAS